MQHANAFGHTKTMLTLMHTHVHMHFVTIPTGAPSLNLLRELRQTENTHTKKQQMYKNMIM